MLICVHISYQILRVMSNCKIVNKKKFLKVVIKIKFLKVSEIEICISIREVEYPRIVP